MNVSDISKVYVINLARRPDRWDAIQQAWQATGVDLPLTRFFACDGRAFDPPKSWDVGRAAYGCYLSHLSILVEAVRNDLTSFLILEDDAVFADDFAAKLALCLADLPSDFDQLYLGWQALHADRVPPTRITEHLGRAGNNNRNHSTIWSRSGAVRFLHRLTELSERKKQHHIDHWMGELHEELTDSGEHAYNVYNCIPQIVYQGSGKSDICGKETPLNKWLYLGSYLSEPKPLADVKSWRTEFGTLGKNGRLGYEKRKTDTTAGPRKTTLSLHAPSEAVISSDRPLSVIGRMNSSGHTAAPVSVLIDGTLIGLVQQPGDETPSVTIPAGEHKLEFLIDKKVNAWAHTYWILSPIS